MSHSYFEKKNKKKHQKYSNKIFPNINNLEIHPWEKNNSFFQKFDIPTMGNNSKGYPEISCQSSKSEIKSKLINFQGK